MVSLSYIWQPNTYICIIKLVKHYDVNKCSHHLGVKTTKYYTQFFFMIRKRLISLEQQNTQNKHTTISKTKTMLVYISDFIIHTHDTNNKMVGKYYGKAIIVKIMS